MLNVCYYLPKLNPVDGGEVDVVVLCPKLKVAVVGFAVNDEYPDDKVSLSVVLELGLVVTLLLKNGLFSWLVLPPKIGALADFSAGATPNIEFAFVLDAPKTDLLAPQSIALSKTDDFSVLVSVFFWEIALTLSVTSGKTELVAFGGSNGKPELIDLSVSFPRFASISLRYLS